MLSRIYQKGKETPLRSAFLLKRNWQSNSLAPTQTSLNRWVQDYVSNPTPESRQRICLDLLLNPNINQLTSGNSSVVALALSSSDEGIKFGMILREDVLELLKKNRQDERLITLDGLLSNWLCAVFCISALKLQRVTFDTSSGLLLERIAADEAVHRIRALSEMKNRLTNGRRCFGFFHPWYSILSLFPWLLTIRSVFQMNH
jgi:hypothetical protein